MEVKTARFNPTELPGAGHATVSPASSPSSLQKLHSNTLFPHTDRVRLSHSHFSICLSPLSHSPPRHTSINKAPSPLLSSPLYVCVSQSLARVTCRSVGNQWSTFSIDTSLKKMILLPRSQQKLENGFQFSLYQQGPFGSFPIVVSPLENLDILCLERQTCMSANIQRTLSQEWSFSFH